MKLSLLVCVIESYFRDSALSYYSFVRMKGKGNKMVCSLPITRWKEQRIETCSHAPPDMEQVKVHLRTRKQDWDAFTLLFLHEQVKEHLEKRKEACQEDHEYAAKEREELEAWKKEEERKKVRAEDTTVFHPRTDSLSIDFVWLSMHGVPLSDEWGFSYPPHDLSILHGDLSILHGAVACFSRNAGSCSGGTRCGRKHISPHMGYEYRSTPTATGEEKGLLLLDELFPKIG
jgi:hypothetical protein